MLKYLRYTVFRAVMTPVARYARGRRRKLFLSIMNPLHGMTVLDIGGHASDWDEVQVPLEITCLNLPGIMDTDHRNHHRITYVVGNGCSMPQFHDRQFDIVFSNSVIEHVGDAGKRAMFAREVQRLAARYWIQTPYKHFPVEAHTGMPFWWLYPQWLRRRLIAGWRKKLPNWTEMVESTDVVGARELRKLFPGASLRSEWLLFPKSLIVYRAGQDAASAR